MASKVYFALIILVSELHHSHAAVLSKYVHCMDVKAGPPGAVGRNSRVTCPESNGYIMTSCSARINGTGRMMGGVIDDRVPEDDQCIAYNDAGEYFKEAIARCCNLTGLDIITSF